MDRLQRRTSITRKTRGFQRGLMLIALGLAMQGTAFAASNLRIHCKDKPFDLETAASDTLTVDVVDLAEGIDDAEVVRQMDEQAGTTEDSLTPSLFLAPRIASILNNVFDHGAPVGEPTSALEADDERPSVAPLAGSTEEVAAPATEATTLSIDPAYLKIYRQMYRTDI